MNILHHNIPQIKALAINAMLTVLIMGRASGKSEGVTANWIIDRFLRMPQSVGGVIIPDYEVKEKIFSKIWKTFNKHNLIEGQDYVIGIQPPTTWPRAHTAPKDKFNNYVSFINGAGFYILSAKSKHNGGDLDWLIVEEARFVPEPVFREIALMLRGNEDYFGHLHCHKSILIVTDRPRQKKEEWVENYEELYDAKRCEAVLKLQLYLDMLEQRLEKSDSELTRKNIRADINSITQDLNQVRTDLVYYGEASTIENIDAIGINTMRTFIRTLSEIDLSISVANKKRRVGTRLFYPTFDLRHQVDSMTFDKEKPLDISFDYNMSILPMCIGQDAGVYYKVMAIHKMKPVKIEQLVADFANIFANHNRKVLNYFMDNTSKQGRNMLSNSVYYEEISKEFRKAGWTVIYKYIGVMSEHHNRFEFFERLYSENDPSLPKIRIWTAFSGMKLCQSIENAEAILSSSNQIKKKKADERNPNVPQDLTTHFSEAADVLLHGKFGLQAQIKVGPGMVAL